MAKRKMAYAVSALAITAGVGVLGSTGVWADGDVCTAELEASTCTAATLEQLQYGLGNGNVSTVNISSTIEVEGTTAIDLVGKTIGCANGSAFEVLSGANFVISDSVGGGVVNGGGNIMDVDGASVEINGGTFKTTRSGDRYGVFLYNSATLTMNGGTIDTTASNGSAVGGNNTTGDMNFIMNNGTLTSKYQTVFMPSQVTLEINGGVLNGGIYTKMGQIVINGGTINGIASGSGLDTLEEYYGLGDGFAWLGDAIAIQGGTYSSTNKQYGNSMNLTINGGTINATHGSAVLVWNAGKVAQSMNVTINGGSLMTTQENTKAVRIIEDIHEVVSNPAAGFGVVENEIGLAISGGTFSDKPDESEVVNDMEPEQGEGGDWTIVPKRIDMKENGAMVSDDTLGGALAGQATFTSEFIADRKASFELSTLDQNEIDALVLDTIKGGDLILPFDASLWNRDGVAIDVHNTSVTVRVALTEEQYNTLAGYDSVKVAYFDGSGAEQERLDATLGVDESGAYYVEFTTSHLSTYAIVGVNETAAAAEDASAAAPETGTVTREGGSAMVASLITAIAVGVITSIVSFAYLMRRR